MLQTKSKTPTRVKPFGQGAGMTFRLEDDTYYYIFFPFVNNQNCMCNWEKLAIRTNIFNFRPPKEILQIKGVFWPFWVP